MALATLFADPSEAGDMVPQFSPDGRGIVYAVGDSRYHNEDPVPVRTLEMEPSLFLAS